MSTTLANFTQPVAPNSQIVSLPLVQTVSGSLSNLNIYEDDGFATTRYRLIRAYDMQTIGTFSTQAAAVSFTNSMVSRGLA